MALVGAAQFAEARFPGRFDGEQPQINEANR